MKSDIPTNEQMIKHSRQSKRVGNGGGDNDDDHDDASTRQSLAVIVWTSVKSARIPTCIVMTDYDDLDNDYNDLVRLHTSQLDSILSSWCCHWNFDDDHHADED